MPQHFTTRRRFTVRQNAGALDADRLDVGDSVVAGTHVGAPLIYGTLRTGGIPHTVNLGMHRMPAVLSRDKTHFWDAAGVKAAADADHAAPERRLPHAASFVMDAADSPVDQVQVSSMAPSFGVRRIVSDYSTVARLQLIAEDPDGALAGQHVRIAVFRNDSPVLLSHRGASGVESTVGAQADASGATDTTVHTAPLLTATWQSRSNSRAQSLQLVETDVELGHIPAAEFVAPPAVSDDVLQDLFLQTADAKNENFFEPGDHFSVLVMSLADREVSFQGVVTLLSLGVQPNENPSATAAPTTFADFYGGDNDLADRPKFRF